MPTELFTAEPYIKTKQGYLLVNKSCQQLNTKILLGTHTKVFLTPPVHVAKYVSGDIAAMVHILIW